MLMEKRVSNRRWKEIVIAKRSKISQKKRPMDLYTRTKEYYTKQNKSKIKINNYKESLW